MKQLLITIVVMYLVIVSISAMSDTADFSLSTQEEMNEMFGAPPDKSVKDWIRFDMVGVVNHPFPIIWFSPQGFERKYSNYLIKLQPEEYRQFKKFVLANKCSIKFDEYTLTHPLRITEYVSGKEQELCIRPEKKVCRYLSNVLMLNGLIWEGKNLDNFQKLVNEYDCPATQKIVELKKVEQ